jgi:hypothetical protein
MNKVTKENLKSKHQTEHTHEGVKYKVDSVLNVSQADADWLVDNKIADRQADQVPEAKREGKKA